MAAAELAQGDLISDLTTMLGCRNRQLDDFFARWTSHGDQLAPSGDDNDVRETHISWIVLSGNLALKIKKSIRNPFLDYSTPTLRLACCLRELRLNRRYVNDLYLDVLAIHRGDSGIWFTRVDSSDETSTGGEDPTVVDYAVLMWRFPDDALLATRLRDQRVGPGEIDRLARTVSRFHESAAAIDATDDRLGTPESIIEDATDNLSFLQSTWLSETAADKIASIRDWTRSVASDLTETFARRRREGFIRHCHGDLHLENILFWRGEFVPFDGVEFNQQFAMIDVQSDAAFVSMDLHHCGFSQFAHRFTNSYLQATGDYAGIVVLRWYQVYRALVRAKVAAIRAGQEPENSEAREHDTSQAQQLVDLAIALANAPKPRLLITHGLSGSGKTFGSQSWVDHHGLIRIRSDVERKRLPGAEDAAAELYSDRTSERTYTRLYDLAAMILNAGFGVVVDATFLKRDQRSRFKQLAQQHQLPFGILKFEADQAVLEQRLIQRKESGGDASDADVDVLHHQLTAIEPLTAAEQAWVVKDSARH
jgi:aminoglycoside phosphotransferase family enzyme/predicted kinase